MLELLSTGMLAAADRITAPVDPARTVALKTPLHPKARAGFDRGPVEAGFPVNYATLLLKTDPSLETFLASQRDPASPNYHHWLSPEEFADRFGLSRNDIAKITAWLESQGLKVNDVARGRHWITFSGTARQIGRALRTEIHRYDVSGERHFANAAAPSVPAALENVVAGFYGLNDFHPQPQVVVAPQFNQGALHLLAPDDFATIYNVAPLYSAGYDGTGQSIAVVGQAAVNLSDIQAFRKKFNLPAKDPKLVLVGPAPTAAGGDLIEANLDLEWSGAVAPNATIVYVYSQDVLLAAQYAIDSNIAPVLTMSFGSCEQESTPELRAWAQQANAQGMTWLASSGDNGAATCDAGSSFGQAAKGPTTSLPASIPEITAVGGTQFAPDSAGYWSSTNGPNGGSALSYIPEVSWNLGFNGTTGGGPSSLYTKPYWQKGPGVPDDGARDTPDISLSADVNYYVVSSGSPLRVGGTSASSPSLAGVIAILNQYLVANGALSQPGLGNINPTLYRLAQAAPDAFHDITAGSNSVPCAQNSPACVNGTMGFNAGPGYDLATGLGTIDAYKLVTQWKNGTASTTTVAAAPASTDLNGTVQLTATVTGGGAPPTGTVTFLSDLAEIGKAALTGAGTSPTASLAVPALRIATADGNVTASYSGDSVYDASSGTAKVNVQYPAGSAVVPSINPNPVYQQAPVSNGNSWYFTLTLAEKNGVASTITGFTVDGEDYSSQIVTFFGTKSIAAHGALSANLVDGGFTPPHNRIFAFSGKDADGRTWSQQVTVPFLGPPPGQLIPAISLFSAPATVAQNTADAACPWKQQLIVQEQSGFAVQLEKFGDGKRDLSSQIETLFGSRQLAPFSSLQATFCASAVSAPETRTYQLSGTSDIGSLVTATATAAYTGPAPDPPPFSVGESAMYLSVADTSGTATATLPINFAGGSPTWKVSVQPTGRLAGWLNISPMSGSGAAQLTITASAAGLSNGAYNAALVIEADAAAPQYLSIPVTFTVGASTKTTIRGVANAASFQQAFAPGMAMSVFGTQLAPSVYSPIRPAFQTGTVTATINGVSAPIYFATPDQINLQVPYETGIGRAVLALNNNGEIATFSFPVSAAAPGIFAAADNMLPAPFDKGKIGDTLTLYITGEGAVNPATPTGAYSGLSTPLSSLPKPLLPVALTVGGVPAKIAFVGIPPLTVGATQINYIVPPNLAPGLQPVVVTVGGVASQTVYLNVLAQ